jgi:hypothetical protein
MPNKPRDAGTGRKFLGIREKTDKLSSRPANYGKMGERNAVQILFFRLFFKEIMAQNN